MPTPLRRSFDYLPPLSMAAQEIATLQPGTRILAPFGRQKLVGILLEVAPDTDIAHSHLKPVLDILERTPSVSEQLLSLGQWAASYYQHPIGDALSQTLPTLLRKNGDASQQILSPTQTHWQLTTEGKGLPEGALKRAAKQAQLLALLQQYDDINKQQLADAGLSRATVKALMDKGLVETIEKKIHETIPSALTNTNQQTTEAALSFNSEQQRAFNAISHSTGYQCFLLEGVTGSGKTEVYLQLITERLKHHQQTLVLIPEIGLTPQTVKRFEQRFSCHIILLHSGLTDKERLIAWQAARSGKASIIIGTRSAVFTPMPKLGLIIIDEEHDSSFKQQDGFRYSARDVAIKRALEEKCPILLGSATPSLETLHNALQGRYQHLQLTQRAAGASTPTFELLDIRHAPMEDGFSPHLITAIHDVINAGNQVLVFINRRGFSPVLLCHDCGFIAQCDHCDARLTVHYQQRSLRCHHCENQQALPHQCPSCNSTQLDFKGTGTERSEQGLKKLFPQTRVIRIDRDTTSRKHAMHNLVEDINQGESCVLVGTQMLAKGHHFPNVTLVAILDADGGLFSADFRGSEKMGQLLIQVAGRAGRADKPGKVMIQTHHPEHPLINNLITKGYSSYAKQLLNERHTVGLPPLSHMAILRADATTLELAEQFLYDLRHNRSLKAVQIFGPLPAPMTRRAGRFRAQLLLQAKDRKALHHALQQLCQLGDDHPLGKKLRWSIDVDPVDAF